MLTCQNCQQPFTISSEDREFYRRIQVPEPTLCPDCRQQRRIAYKNDKTLYDSKCQLCCKAIISMYSPDKPYIIYCQDCYWSDKWDALKSGRAFDFNRSFFGQFKDLQLKVPRVALVNNKAENSDYCNFADRNHHCYLITTANDNDDCYYGFWMLNNRDCFDLLCCRNCELSYELVDCNNCYLTFHSQFSSDCNSSRFLFDCRNCQDCLGCVGLRNAQYYLLNRAYSEEEYKEKIKHINYQTVQREFEKLKLKHIRKNFTGRNIERSSGDYLYNCQNVCFSFDVHDSQNGAYLYDGLHSRDCYDTVSFDSVEFCYETMSAIGFGYLFSYYCRNSHNLTYCDTCHSSSDLFGCVGLRHKSFCILNKEYTENEYLRLKTKIIAHMRKTGEYGEAFPVGQSLFAYNETIAQIYFPLSKEQAISKGYTWKDPEPQKKTLGSHLC